jgi:hypothetical protein
MNTDHADVTARFSAPAERDLPPGRHQLHREILMNHVLSQSSGHETAHREAAHRETTHRETTPRPGRTWRRHGRLLAAVAAGTALAGGVVGYVITAGSAPTAPTAPAAAQSPTASHAGAGSATGSATRQATLAAKILGTAAAHVARAAVAEPSRGQWIYYKTVDYSAASDGWPGVASTDEEWITFDGSGSAYYQGGQLRTHTSTAATPGADVNPWAAWNMTATPKTAYDVLAALPVNPQALLTVIAAKSAGQSADDLVGNPIAGQPPTTQAQREFDLLTEILWDAAPGVGGPPAVEAASYRALATLPGITVQPGVTDTAGRPAIGISDDGGLDQLLIEPVSYQVIGIRNLASGVAAPTIAQMLASGHIPADLRAHLATMTKAQRAQYIAQAESAQKHPVATPRRGAVMQEIVYVKNTEVPGPGDR